MGDPVARSAVPPAPPVVVRDGWEVSGRRSTAALRLLDASPLGKVLVRATPPDVVESAIGVRFGRTVRDDEGCLVVGSGPGEWTVLCLPGRAPAVADRLRRDLQESRAQLLTVVDVTHGRTLFRLTGADAARVLAAVCAIDLHDRVAPDGLALRTDVARVVTDVVRDDLVSGDATERSYLLHCERSSGAHLFEVLLDAGEPLGLDVDGLGAGAVDTIALGRGTRTVPPSGRRD